MKGIRIRRGDVRVRGAPTRRSIAYNAGIKNNDVIVAIEYHGAVLTQLEEMRAALRDVVHTSGRMILSIRDDQTTAAEVHDDHDNSDEMDQDITDNDVSTI